MQAYKNEHETIPGNPSTAKSSALQLRTEATAQDLLLLSESDWNFWKTNGYIVIKGAISKVQAAKTADFLWEFEEKKPEDPSTWYTQARAEMQMKELVNTGMVEVYNHQTLWSF